MTSPSPPQNNRPVSFVLLFCIACAVISSVSVIAAFFPFFVIVPIAIFMLPGLHYVVWGWWLAPALRKAEAERLASRGRDE